MDAHDTTQDQWALTSGWLVCPTCEGDGIINIGELAIAIDCPDCGGTGEPPMKQVS